MISCKELSNYGLVKMIKWCIFSNSPFSLVVHLETPCPPMDYYREQAVLKSAHSHVAAHVSNFRAKIVSYKYPMRISGKITTVPRLFSEHLHQMKNKHRIMNVHIKWDCLIPILPSLVKYYNLWMPSDWSHTLNLIGQIFKLWIDFEPLLTNDMQSTVHKSSH